MRFIDEKGRLFGKINVIDFLVILSLFCILPAFYFGYKILNRPTVTEERGVFTSIDAYAILKDLSLEGAKLISVGDKELDDNGNVIGEILDIDKIESNFIEIDLSEEETIVKEDVKRKQASVKMRLTGRINGNDILYKENKIKIGSMIDFKTAKYRAKGIIISKISEPSREIKVSKSGFNPIIVSLLFRNLSPEIARLVSEGDFETGGDGDTIAKVLAVGKPEPYSYKVDLGGGNYATRTDSQKRQLLVKMEIMGRIEGNVFYFRDKRIALDSRIEFNTNKYNIKGMVVKEPAEVKRIDKKWKVLKVKFTNLVPELASLISEDDEERYISGELVAKVTSVLNNEPAEVVVPSQDGRLNIAKDPIYRDVIVLMKVRCIKAQKGLFFKETRIKVGNNLSLQTEEYDVNGTIIGIEEIKDQ
ncbi:MAG: DUF4330 family protein [Candidatus Omnitrophica bacterium]|nr:DUF4330 family protein [Candidatus Omnitrophota bacterium]